MTESTRALTIARPVTPDLWQMLFTIGESAFKSRNMGVSSQAEAAIKMLTGHELGLPPMASLRSIYVVKGKATIQPKAAWGLIIQHPDYAGIVEERLTDAKGNFTGYAITLKRKNGMEAKRDFTLADAARAGLADKDNWKAYPENMCYWRAMGFAQDAVFPDVTMGISRSDELGADIDPSGNVVDAQWREMPTASQAAEVQPATDAAPWEAPTEQQATVEQPKEPIITLDQLVQEFGAEAVMVTAEGRIPATDDEVAGVWAKLKLASVA